MNVEMTSSLAIAASYIGGALNVLAFFMKVPIRLRQIAIAANVALFVFASINHFWATEISNAILVPLNIWRLRDLYQTRSAVRAAMATTNLSWDWLRPFMTRRHVPAGATIFRKGDVANALFFILAGNVRFPEIGRELGIGQLFGEIAMFSPARVRMSGAVATADTMLLAITAAQLAELYESNPQFGVYIVRLITERLLEDLAADGDVDALAATRGVRDHSDAISP